MMDYATRTNSITATFIGNCPRPKETSFTSERYFRKKSLQSKVSTSELDRQKPIQESVPKPEGKVFGEFRDEFKSEILTRIRSGSGLDHHELTNRAVEILDASFARNGLAAKADHEAMSILSRELSDRIGKAPSQVSTRQPQASRPNPESIKENTNRLQKQNS